METVSRTAKSIAKLYRIATAAALVLTFALFITGGDGSLARTLLFLAWFALMLYSLIRVLTDLFSGRHQKERNFQHSLDMLEKQTGSPEAAAGTLTLVALLSLAVKLAVPVVLWAVFR